MLQTESISFEEAGTLNDLVKHYLQQNESLKKFYKAFPSVESFKSELKTVSYADLDRKKLSLVLSTQAENVSNTSATTLENIRSLESKNSFTITTGHQLCLFTGPLYFIYKIFSVINLCEHLKKEFPSYKFIPVYWAASEDHDFEEVNHFFSFGKKITWPSVQQGAVGEFETGELSNTLEEIKNIFGDSPNSIELISLFEKAYLKNKTLADATRYLVNELFGEFGLVTVDGNDAEFKKQFVEEFKTDILENSSFKYVSESLSELEKSGYKAQVNPREINCFFLEKNKRSRIEKSNEEFVLVNENKSFNEKELMDVVQKHPEKISPNVVLRPLYQQTILPNLAYVGGPGELAYWLEYKKMFDASGKNFPLLIMRASVSIADHNTVNKIQKLNLVFKDFFKPEQEILKKYLAEKNQVFDVKEEAQQIASLFSTLEEKLSGIDKTLIATTKAELQKCLNSLKALEGKANRALKQQSETELKQITSIKEKFFPDGILQERRENFSTFYIPHGKEFLNIIKGEIEPFDYSHKVIVV